MSPLIFLLKKKDVSLDLSGLSTFQEDDYVRVRVYKKEEIIGEVTGKIIQTDWDKKDIKISFPKLYLRKSCVKPKSRGQSFPFVLDSCLKKEESYTSYDATLDKSPSDFVGRRIHKRLQELQEPDRNDLERILKEPPEVCDPPYGWSDKCRECAEFFKKDLKESQAKALDNLLSSRVFPPQGPPGTGKTQTTAAAILMYALCVLYHFPL